ncbi:isochorismatase family protein [Cellulomonas sp.]|uniref:isochorismatase family protein n=1 Tax=Cellulomonas sp. TaxID=40001 RepID=UPI00258E78F2|nr:isochorismatase family protein [Cellulomonas sp.]MCR6688801.1 isochorismatase family protein [Cellulomonas sp.]
MPVDTLDPATALVLVDLQNGITALPTVHDASLVVARAALLAEAAHRAGLPVVRVRTAFSSDGGDVLRGRTDSPGPAVTQAADFAELDARVPSDPADLVVTKRGWDAFTGTELDSRLRRRGVRCVVIAGISTSIGVESTARTARELGYEVVVAHDAVTDLVAAAHATSLEVILPRIARLDTAEAIAQCLAGER